jgi:acetoin utilization protein AcuC
MSCSLRVVWDDALTAYNFGPSHPLAPVRVDLTMRLARAFGLFELPQVALGDPVDGADELLELVHTPEYIGAVRRAAADPAHPDLGHGLGSDDNPIFPAIHDASARVAGASVAAAGAVWRSEAAHAVNIAGGLHHAMPDRASGFCIYNDVAIAIAWLLEHGAERVAYVDVDVHHGDGVQAVFWDDPRVLTISLHETGRALFPGTGFPDEVGGRGADGTAVNVALPPGTGDEGWLRAFHAVVPQLVEAFQPQVLASQHGCDTHFLDPLAHLTLSVDGQRTSYAAIHQLAHKHAGGRWLATGGGGYEIVDVVPRAWTHLLAAAAGQPIEPTTPTPDEWREHVKTRLQRVAPARMTDGRTPAFVPWAAGHDPDDWLDRSINATRKAVFPLHGLDPDLDL